MEGIPKPERLTVLEKLRRFGGKVLQALGEQALIEQGMPPSPEYGLDAAIKRLEAEANKRPNED